MDFLNILITKKKKKRAQIAQNFRGVANFRSQNFEGQNFGGQNFRFSSPKFSRGG